MALLLLALGCGEEPAAPTDPAEAADPCFGGDLSRCNVLEATCQARIFDVVSCLRGAEDGEPPTTYGMTPEQFAEHMRPEPEVERRHNRFVRALSLLGLEPAVPGAVAPPSYYPGYLGASYRPDDATVMLGASGTLIDSTDAMAALAHEHVHAQQDREHDLEAFVEGARGSDARLARLAVVEGEARLYQLFFWTSLEGHPLSTSEWNDAISDQESELDRQIASSDGVYDVATGTFPYVRGLALTYEAYRREGQAGIRALFDEPPASTWWMLYGGSESSSSTDDAEPVEYHLQLPEDVVFASSTEGAWMLRSVLLANGLSSVADSSASDWDSDALAGLYDEGEDEAAFFWLLVFRSPSSAEEVYLDLRAALGTERVTFSRDEDTLLLVGAESEVLRIEVEDMVAGLVSATRRADMEGHDLMIRLDP